MNDRGNSPDQPPARICRECIEISKINFAGNIIPKTWFKAITYPSGKPDMLAINILSEIVYWYRLIEECDERTGKVTGYRQRFHADMLQRSYQGFADLFGVSRRQVKMAMDRLVETGLVRTEFRTVQDRSSDMILNNVLFLAPVPETVSEVTHTQHAETEDSCTPSYNQMQEGVHSNVPGPTFDCRTYTKNNTKITTKINNIKYDDDNKYTTNCKEDAETSSLQKPSSSSSSFENVKEKKNDGKGPGGVHLYFPPADNESEAEMLAREVMGYQISTGTKVPEHDRQRYLFALMKKAMNGALMVPSGYRPPEERKQEEDRIVKSEQDRRMKEKAERDRMREGRAEQDTALKAFLLLPEETQKDYIKRIKAEYAQAAHLMPDSMITRLAAMLYAKGGLER